MKYVSNHFPKPIKEVVKKVIIEPTNLNERGSIILSGLEKNCPNLYRDIMNVKPDIK